MSKPVVVGVDGSSGSRTALRWAATEASRRGLALRVVLAVHAASSQLSAAHDGDDADDTLRSLTQLASSYAPDLSVSSHLLPGHPRPTLTEESRYAELLVLGQRGAGGFAGLRLGSVALGVSRASGCPVVVVPARDAVLPTEVVVGVDGWPHSDSAVGYAFEMAELHDMPVRAVHAPAGSEADGPDPTHPGLLDRALATWSDRYPDVKVIAETVPGHPVKVLSEYARSAWLLVVGHHGQGRLLGSVAHGLLHHAHGPVAVVGGRHL